MHQIESAAAGRGMKMLAVAVFSIVASVTPAAAQTASPVETHGDWTMYAAETRGTRLCFVTTQPTDVKPEGARRDPIHFYVSAWPKDGVMSEISIKLGYPLRKGSEPTVSVGTQSFKLFVKDDKALKMAVDLLRELQDRHNLAYLFISHDLRVIRAMAHDLIVMKDGVVVESGPAAEIFANPKQDYTRTLLEAALNLKTRKAA